MSPAGQLWGHLVGSAFIHIRACLPQDYPHIQIWLQHLTWFWPSWMDIEQSAWLEAKGVDFFVKEPTPGGTNHKAWRRASTGWSLHSESGTLNSDAELWSQELVSENLQWGSRSSRPQTSSLEPQCGGSSEMADSENLWSLGVHSRSSWVRPGLAYSSCSQKFGLLTVWSVHRARARCWC